jgi:hypothetical protein
MDVTGRSEEDRAAQRLVANILDYVAGYSPEPARAVTYVGEAAGQAHLEKSGFALTPYPAGADAVLVVGPGAGRELAGDANSLRTWLEGGGRLFALGLGAADANAFMPFPVATTTAEHIDTVFEREGADSTLAAIGPAEVHNRGPREIELISGGATVIGNGVLATALDGNVVFCQLPPWSFDYEKQYNLKRTFRRTAFLVTRVLGNMGCQSTTPLLERFSMPVAGDEAEPRWLQGFYLDEPAEFDDPYRSFGW